METATSSGAGPDAAPRLDPNLTDPALIRQALTASVTGQPLPAGVVTPPNGTEPAQPAPAEPVVPAPVPPVEPPAGSTPPVVPPVEPADDGDNFPGRISTKQFEPEAKRAFTLQRALNEGKMPGDPGFVPLAEALRQVQAADNPTPPAASPAAAPQPTRLDTLSQTVQSTEQKLTELRVKRAELAKEGTLYGEDIDAIQNQIDDTVMALSDAKSDLKLETRQVEQSEAQRQQQAHETAVQARVKAKESALQQYPSAGEKDTPLYSEIAKLVTELKQPGHPDAGILGTQNAAVTITEKAAIAVAQRLAQEKGTTFAQEFEALQAPKVAGSTPPPVTPGTPPPVAPKVLPGMGRQTPVTAVPEKTGAEVLKEVGTDPVAIRAALAARRGAGQPIALRL